MTLAFRNDELLQMVDTKNATVDRRMFFDTDIYQLELERIFARSWLFMCHESPDPQPGRLLHDLHGRGPRHRRPR